MGVGPHGATTVVYTVQTAPRQGGVLLLAARWSPAPLRVGRHGRGAADGNTNVKLFLYSYVYGLGFRV